MNQNRYYIPVVISYFAGIVLGMFLSLQLPESFRTGFSVYRMIAEELFWQEVGIQLMIQCIVRRMLFLLLLLLAYFSRYAVLRYALAGYLGIVLSVSISALTVYFHVFGILYTAAFFLPQGILYGWTCCMLLLDGDHTLYLPRINFLRCGICSISWMIGAFLEILLQPYMLRLVSTIWC